MDDDAIGPARRGPVPPDPLYLVPGGADEAAAAQREHVIALVEELALTEARIAALHAHQVSVLATLQVHPHTTTTGLDIADELAPRLRWTTFTTDRRLATAARVATCFPLLYDDLRGAEIDYHRLDVVVRESDLLDEDQARVLDAVLTGHLPGLTTAQIRHLVRREIALIDSHAVKERARRVITDRRIAYTALPDGQGLLEVLGPATTVRAAYDHLHTLAHDTTHPATTTDPYATHPGLGPGNGPGPGAGHGRGPGTGATAGGSGEEPTHDTRGIDAKRFDVCIDSLLAPPPAPSGHTPNTARSTAPGTGPQITIAWTAAVGLDDLPAHLSGHGPIPAETVRHLLQHTGFRGATTHPTTGHLTATDGHLHPPGTLPDLTRDPAGRGTDELAATRDRTRLTTPPGATGPSRDDAPAVTTPTTTAPSIHGVDDPAPSPGVVASVIDGSRRPSDPVGDVRADRDDFQWGDDQLATTDASTGGGRRRLHDAPHEVPDEIALAGPGPGWSDELGGHDDGYDIPTVTGPDTSDFDAYVTQVLVDADEPLIAELPPATRPSGNTPSQGAGLLHPEVVDPATGPRADEFKVTLAITALRPATLTNPHRVHDTAAWTRRADHRARTALATCPATADPRRPYRFSAAQRRFLVLRSPTCTAPGCRAPAHRCDLDHTTAHSTGGPTCPCNATPLCRRHHTAKHAAWTVTRTHDDPQDPSLTWLSPLGYLYTVPATPLFPPVPAVITAHLGERRAAARALEQELADLAAGGSGDTSDGSAGDRGGDGPSTPTADGAPAASRHAVDHQGDRDCRACDPDRPPVLHRPRPTPAVDTAPGRPHSVDPGNGVAPLPGLTIRAPEDPDGDPPF